MSSPETIERAEAGAAPLAPSASASAPFALSPTQEGMLFHSLYAPTSGVYFEQSIYRLEGDVDARLFQQAWAFAVQRHEILRTSFVWEEEEKPTQAVQSEVVLPFQEHDWREFGQTEQAERLRLFLEDDLDQGFDLAAAPLMRVHLIRFADAEYRFIWSHHHILLDGWSQTLLLKEVFSTYRALGQDEPAKLKLAPVRPYRDFVSWLHAQDLTEAEVFWRQSLSGIRAPTPLGIDRPTRDAALSFGEAELPLSSNLTATLQDFARQHRLTMYTLLQGAWALLLSHYGRTEDTVFGATVSVRPPELQGIEQTAGLFINTIPVRTRVAPGTHLVEWLQDLQLDAVEAREYQHAPLLEIQRWSDVPRGVSLFDSILVFENYPADDSLKRLGAEVSVQREHSVLSRTNYPLALLVEPGPELMLHMVYDVSRFDAEAVIRMLGHLEMILRSMVTHSSETLSQVSLLTPAERQQLISDWNSTDEEYESHLAVHHLFQQQAAATPEAVAVAFEDQQLTYAELNERSNQLARYLRTLGVGPETLAGIFIDRSIEMVVGLLGILKAGAAYVPLDPAFPKERLAFMIDDSRVRVLVTTANLVNELPPKYSTHSTHSPPATPLKIVALDSDASVIARESVENLAAGAGPENLAYVIYTSGSTGVPKGVEIGHRALTNFLCSVRRQPGLASEDILLSVTTLSFDIAALEIYLPLIVGARLVVLSREVAADGIQLGLQLTNSAATAMQATPSTWRMLIEAGWDGNKDLKALCGGEALPPELAKELLARGVTLWNMYGPTETTIWSAARKVENVDSPISIGRPMANTRIYLLDERQNPVPVGIAGELHIGGDGVARGYLNRPELTAEKFIPSPFSHDPGARLYKTGDLARYLRDGNPEGNIECLGRIDDQVKVRGFRVELGEIESTLRQHSLINDCVVVAREHTSGHKRLVAYVVAGEGQELSSRELREHLRAKLPDYMVPSMIVELKELPLTPNGKVDRRALPAPDHDGQLREMFVAPRTPVEEGLARIWSEVLGVERLSIQDNFFDLGGHSLVAAQLISRARNTFSVDLPLRSLFETPTVAGLAKTIYEIQTAQTEDCEMAAMLAELNELSEEEAQLQFAEES